MNFKESVEYLYNLGNEVLAMKLGLENIGKLLTALGDPQKKYLKVQVAGTNGKGSTCAFLEAICLKAGISVGMTTSPHLISVTERVRINGVEISETDFARHATLVRETSEQLVKNSQIRNPKSEISLETVPTYFEQVTAIALNAFAEAGIELAILETGLGGRFDATTAARAEIVAITPIDYDHQRILGETLPEIAAEKAAIIREDTKVIIAPQRKEAERVILGKCREKGVEPIWATTDFQIKKDSSSLPMIFATFKTPSDNYPNVLISLNGRHQFDNAATAIAIAETLRDFNLDISQNAIIAGLETAKHRGRLEFVDNFLFDGAHNASGARALRVFLDEFVEKPLVMIFGAMRDKNLGEIIEILFPKANKIVLTAPDNPRSMSAAELFELLPKDFDRENVFVTENVESALKLAQGLSGENDLICVTGSLYLIGEAQKILSENVLST